MLQAVFEGLKIVVNSTDERQGRGPRPRPAYQIPKYINYLQVYGGNDQGEEIGNKWGQEGIIGREITKGFSEKL